MSASVPFRAMGAVVSDAGVHFRVWAPRSNRVEVVFSASAESPLLLEPDGTGCYEGLAAGARAGTLYQFRLDGAETFPDPMRAGGLAQRLRRPPAP